MKRFSILLIALAVFLLISCAEKGTEEPVSAPTPATTAEPIDALPTEEPTPTTEPTHDMSGVTDLRGVLIVGQPDDNGDIELYESETESIVPTTFPMNENTIIVIYHTHAREAYRQTDTYTYEETEPDSYRTTEQDKSVIAIGEVLAEELRAMGYTVIHDSTDMELPKLGTAYTRSLALMESYSYADVFIDLHRNAANVKIKSDDVTIIDGERCARMFFVVGTGIGSYEGEFDVLPNWKANYALALSLMENLREIDVGLITPMRVKTGRYNQHVSDKCILLELGHNANTFDDVMNSVKYFAQAFAETLPLKEG